MAILGHASGTGSSPMVENNKEERTVRKDKEKRRRIRTIEKDKKRSRPETTNI